MKRLLTILALCATTSLGFAQGQINFNNRVIADGIDFRVFLPDGTTPALGADFIAALYGGPVGTAEADLQLGEPTTVFRATAAAAGYVDPAIVVIPGVDAGADATVQLRVWHSSFDTFASAQAGGGLHGASHVFTVEELGGGALLPANMLNLGTGELVLIPEPSTIALGILGFAALLFRFRRK